VTSGLLRLKSRTSRQERNYLHDLKKALAELRIAIVVVTVRRERRWTSAGATPARELVRSTR
jgi:hypothetical protein